MTDEQRVPDPKTEWEDYKAWSRGITELVENRGVPIPPAPNTYRGARLHNCNHTLKKHKASGRCRKGCDCTYALDKV